MDATMLVLHLLGTTIWTGGHLLLALAVLPRALRAGSLDDLQRFESWFAPLAMPALVVQVATGVWLTHQLLPDVADWVDLANPASRAVAAKFLLLALTVALHADARLRIGRLEADHRLRSMAWHVVAVTILAVLFVVVGTALRQVGHA